MIKGRVTSKSQRRTFNNKSGVPGKVFSVDLLDKFGGEIRASFFNDAVDQYEDMLKTGQCYVFSRGTLKVANKQYNATNHRYELVFDKQATVAPCADDADIKTFQYNFVDLRNVQAKSLAERGTKFDLCGVITSFKPVIEFTSRDGKSLVKREITLADDTALCIDIALWGDRATLPDSKFEGNPVVALKGVLVKEWNGGRAGSLLQDGNLDLQYDGGEAQRIRNWWTTSGSSAEISALSVAGVPGNGKNARWLTLAEVRELTSQISETTETFNVSARLSLVQTQKQGERQPLSYMACSMPREGTSLRCNKRVGESGQCPACNSVGKGEARLNIRCQFTDSTDSTWMTTFHEGATAVLGMSAEDVRALEQAPEELEDKLRQLYYSVPLQLTVRAKSEVYQGEPRTAISCINARALDCAEHSDRLMLEIKQMLGMQSA
jgi:replication factor A1